MGWLEPGDRTMHEKPHECAMPIRCDLPGARWQCDECGHVKVWSWIDDLSDYQWISETPYLVERLERRARG